jgi:hypothetical protein
MFTLADAGVQKFQVDFLQVGIGWARIHFHFERCAQFNVPAFLPAQKRSVDF